MSHRHHQIAALLWSGVWLLGTAARALAGDADAGASLSVTASYTGDYKRNTHGGAALGDAYADSVDLGLVWVSEGLLGDARMTTNLSVMHLGGGDISARSVGDLQGVSNLEAGNGWKLYESWVEVAFGNSGGQSLRFGVLDLNAEFDTPETQGIFTASPFGIGTEFSQTGARGPVCWPLTGLGVRLTGEWDARWHWRLGAYDGAPNEDSEDAFVSTRVSAREGAIMAGELEYRSERIHKFALGLWSYTANFVPLRAGITGDESRRGGNLGGYGHLDARLGSLGGVDLDGAVRLGLAPARFNAIDRYAGAAVTASHLFAARPADSLGLGVAWAHLGDDYRALSAFTGTPLSSAETTVELIYRAEILPGLTLLPNVQYVDSPGAYWSDAWVAGLRFEITHEKSWPLAARESAPGKDVYVRTSLLEPQGKQR